MSNHRSTTVIDVPDINIQPYLDSISELVNQGNRDHYTFRQTYKEKLQKRKEAFNRLKDEYEEKIAGLEYYITVKLQENCELELERRKLRTALGCLMCMDKNKSMFAKCGHGWCEGCLHRLLAESASIKCPDCHAPIDINDVRRISLSPEIGIEVPVIDQADNARPSGGQGNPEAGGGASRVWPGTWILPDGDEVEVIVID